MKQSDNLELEQQGKQSRVTNSFDLLVILPLVLKNWYWFIIGIIIAMFVARWYINHTMTVYRTSATILVNERDEAPLVDNSELLQGLGLPGGMKNLQNQIMILKSRALTENTLNQLPFEVEYYFKTIRNQLPVYPEVPIKVVSDKEIPLPKDSEFSISFLDNKMFTLKSESDFFPFQKTASFEDTISVQGGSFIIECLNEKWLNENKDRKLYFVVFSRTRLINNYCNRLNVDLVSREGSILRMSLEGTNTAKDVDFLNKHIEGFQAISLNKKNTEAQRRIQFIDNQLVGVSDSLKLTETSLQQFRSSHRVMDLSAQGQSIIEQVTLLENEKARLNLEANYYDYLGDYLNKETSGEIPIIPITMGITDPGLTKLVNELAELQGQLSTRGAGEMNPLQRNLEQRIRTTKDALRETLNGLKRRNSLARSENQEQINRANSQASTLPVTERQLLGFERKFKVTDELYTFLLETRSEQEMQKASNRADSEVIDPADTRFSSIVSPNRIMINLVGLFAGFILPLVIIFLNFLFNKKLKTEDISRMTDIPIVGNIPHNGEKTNTVVLNYPNSTIAETFRLLRSRMQFFIKEAKAPVILITSTMPGDGKTFTAINLASAYSLLGKKTILVGFDLRKPKIFTDFNLDNEKGVSTWLIGKDNLKDIIKDTTFNNLSVVSAGPVPPNPSELTALEKTGELLKLLKESYDYIIIDSSPIGVVSDTFHLASMADSCLLVVRPGKTMRDVFENTLNELNASNIKGVSLVINDIQADSRHYGYGDKYGYTVDKERSGKFKYRRSKHVKRNT
jgi:tyrosine-protein kinase Etk/Wzc